MQAVPTVFIVDDDPAVTKAAGQLAEVIGFKSQVFNSAAGFLDAYRPNGPACLVLDLRMPGMSGIELQQALLNTGKTLPIVVMTGHADTRLVVKAMQLGAVGCLEKPFPVEDFCKVVREAVQQSEEAWRNRSHGS